MSTKQIASCLVALALLAPSAARAASLTLAANSKSDYQIVIPDAAPSLEIGQWMTNIARLVQTAFQTNGFEIAIVPESQRDAARPAIFLGDTKFARANGVEVAKFPDWRYVHKVVGRDVIVAGRDQPCPVPLGPEERPHAWHGLSRIGTMKAAADFLRQYAGTRFLFPGETGIEFLKTPVIAVPSDLDFLKVPSLQFHFHWWTEPNVYDIANGYFAPTDLYLGAHVWPEAIPADKYRETHPEYFALINGTRCCGRKNSEGKWTEQYCISNPEVRELIYREMLRQADRGYETVGLGQPDGFMACQCEACKPLYGTVNDWGEKIWILHRDLAERFRKDRPGKKLIIMSYGLTTPAPKTFKEFPGNVIVLLCNTTPKVMKEWDTCNVPGGYFAYTYTFIGGCLPRQTPLSIEEEGNRLLKLGVRGIYFDGFFGNYGLMGPVFYVKGRMFDDPARVSAKDLLEEFYEGAFRETVGPMHRFYDTLYHAVQFSVDVPNSYEDVYGRPRSYLGDDAMRRITMTYTPEALAELEKYLSQAERLASSEKVKRRLALVRLEFNYIRHIATIGHLWTAYRVAPDQASRDRLLDAVEAWNAFLDLFFRAPPELRYAKNNIIPGWPEMMLFHGNGRGLVALTGDNHNIYGNSENTPLAWLTTAEMRKAPVATAKRLAVKAAPGAVAIDGADWTTAQTVALDRLPGGTGPLTRKTTLRALYDKNNLYLRADCELPGTIKEFAPVMRDGQPAPAESLDIAIDPFGTKEKCYRFLVGPKPEPRYQAARGFITDTLHPLYGKDDPAWAGAWKYESRLEPQLNRWLALLTIPYKTLGVDVPAAGAVWRANAVRAHLAGPNQVERSIWSGKANTKGVDDLSAFAEMVFDDGSSVNAGAAAVQKVREELYRTYFDVPAEWKTLPARLPDSAWGPWRFREDPTDKGTNEGWYGPDFNDSGWMPITVPAFWAETAVGDYLGYGWYRTSFTLPVEWKDRAVRILFGSVDGQAWVYLNGKLVKERTVQSDGPIDQIWDAPFIAEIKPEHIKYGETNLMAVRVHKLRDMAGIWRPVLVHAGGKK